MAKPYKQKKQVYGGPWRRIRQQVLERDQHQCQIRQQGCTRIATTVDHIQPLALGGEWYEPTNLRAACSYCNIKLGHKTRALLAGKRSTVPLPTQSAPASRQW